MEVLSQTKLHDYEEILQQISNEYEKTEHLKRSIDRENNRIVIKKISESDRKFKISHTTIKIFDNIHEIFALYEQEVEHLDLQQFHKLENVRFGLIEIFITDNLLEKLPKDEWKINIKAAYPQSNYCKVSKLLHKTPIIEIIPLENNLWEFSIEISIFKASDYCIIDLYKADIDISYYFQSNKPKKSINLDRNHLKISQLYCNDNRLEFDENLPQNQCQFLCNFNSKSDLIGCLVKNSYHRLNFEIFTKFTKENQNNVLEIQFYIDEYKVLLSYNCITQIMKVRCNLELLPKLKEYFLKSANFDYGRLRPKIQALLSKKQEFETYNSEKLLQLYQEIRNLWL